MSGIHCDFSGLRKLSSALEKMGSDGARAFLNEQTKDCGQRLLAKTKLLTPVVTGNLRRNWQATQVESIPGGCQVEIYNNTSYAPYVEYGHRNGGGYGWTDGRFMMTKAINELQSQMPNILEKGINDYFDRSMKWQS